MRCEMIHVVLAKKEVLWSAWFTQSIVNVLTRETALCRELACHKMKCGSTQLACA